MLRIFLGENDRREGKPLYKQIVMKARGLGLAGATVSRGILCFCQDSRLHSSEILTLSEDLPLIIEIVDSREKINLLLPFIDEWLSEGLVTLEKITVIKYRHA